MINFQLNSFANNSERIEIEANSCCETFCPVLMQTFYKEDRLRYVHVAIIVS